MIEEEEEEDEEAEGGVQPAVTFSVPVPEKKKKAGSSSRDIYNGVPYKAAHAVSVQDLEQGSRRPGEGDGAGTVAENLINELRMMA